MNTIAKLNQLASVGSASIHVMWFGRIWRVSFESITNNEKIELKAEGDLSEAIDKVFERVVELGHAGLTSLHIPLLESPKSDNISEANRRLV